MKKEMFFLTSMLSFFIVGCNENISPEISDCSTQQIYYIDGLSSNLFVSEIPEYMSIYKDTSGDYYRAEIDFCELENKGLCIENIDCVVPNVYDDGIDGYKRIKSFYVYKPDNEKGYFNTLTISEGIEVFSDEIRPLGNIPAREIRIPSSTKEIYQGYGWATNWTNKQEYGMIDKCIFSYNGTVEQFSKIKKVTPSPLSLYWGPFKKEFVCLDGKVFLDFYHGPVEV